MKKLLLGSLSLFLFSISILVFQISCKDEAIAEVRTYILPPASTSSLGGVIVGEGLNITEEGTLSVNGESNGVMQKNKFLFLKYPDVNNRNKKELWIANYDGDNQQKINISFPDDMVPGEFGLSPDGSLIFFGAYTADSDEIDYIYSCNIDGSNLTKIFDDTDLGSYAIEFLIAF